MSDAQPRVSVVVPTYGRPDVLEDALADVAGQDVEAGFEIVVVVRPEDEASRRVAERTVPNHLRRVTEVTGPGMVRALRAGLEASRGEVVAIGDDDARYPADWLRRLLGWFADPSVGAAGGPFTTREGDRPPPRIPRVSWYGRTSYRAGDGAPAEAHHLFGTNMAFRRTALRPPDLDPALDGPGYAPGSELALCFAVRRRGFRVVYDPSIVVRHLGVRPGRSEIVPATTETYSRNVALIMRQELSPLGRLGFLAYFWVVGQWRSPGLAVWLVGRLTRRVPHERWLRTALIGKAQGWRRGRPLSAGPGPGRTPPPGKRVPPRG